MMNKNELTPTANYAALAGFNLADALSEEMVGMDVTFDRIKIPAAGGTVFEVPGDAPGETDAVKEFSGVILYHHPLYSYYRERFAGGNAAPDCGSYDGVAGVGIPGGPCAQCPLNQFGSGENGGKACKNKRRIYILREGELIPLLLTLPTGSMKEFSVYIKRLLAKGRKSSAVVTRFSLKKVTNAGGIAYSQAQFAVERALSAEELPYIAEMVEQVKQFAVRVAHESDAPEIDPFTGEILKLEPTSIE
ncbi:MAG: hypothetical protein GX647_10860 [Clostridiales bacterium]|nr:hypothetical protein [Clostridiales bacterium]